MDYNNQLSIFDPDLFKNKSGSIVGVGSVGSFTTLVLAKMGIKNIYVYDGDTIEEHNIPNQFYKLDQINQKKTKALKQIVNEFSDVRLNTNGFVDKKTVLISDIVILCTDSMKSRKLSFNKAKRFSNYLIDSRMSGNTYRIYTLNLKDKEQVKKYRLTLYDDNSADKERCTEKTIIYNVAEIASKIANQVKKVFNKEEFNNFLAYDFKNDLLLKKRWLKLQ